MYKRIVVHIIASRNGDFCTLSVLRELSVDVNTSDEVSHKPIHYLYDQNLRR